MALFALLISTQILTLLGSEGLVTTTTGINHRVSFHYTFSTISCDSNEFSSFSTFVEGEREHVYVTACMHGFTDRSTCSLTWCDFNLPVPLNNWR